MDSEHIRPIDQSAAERRVFLTLDLECDYGTALAQNSYEAVRATNELIDLLEKFETPLSCFLQTEVIDTAPSAIRALATADVPVEIHAHSHTHPSRDVADVQFEVTESATRVRDQFGTTPLGFRFPDGAIESTDYEVRAEHDIAFSSSVFPSFRPGRFNNLQATQHPHIHQPSGVVELPFTVLSTYVPVPVALSYLKLFGTPFQQLLWRRPPVTIVFDFHMHDLVVPPAFDSLPAHYQVIYGTDPAAEFLVDSYGYLTALFRVGLSGHLDYVDRNLMEKWFQTQNEDRPLSSLVGRQSACRRPVACTVYVLP